MPFTIILTLIYLRVLTIAHGTDSEVLYPLVQTCDHVYGTILDTLPSVQSLITCGMRCTQLSTCRSAMYSPTSLTCTLNSDTADTGTLPSDCGVTYLLGEPVPVSSGQIGDACNVTSPCDVNGGVCIAGSCSCDVGLTFDENYGVCSSAEDSSVCQSTDWCFPGQQHQAPWNDDIDHLRVEMSCQVSLPSPTITAGTLRIAILADVPVSSMVYDTVDTTPISDRETIFTYIYYANSPHTFTFYVIYYGQMTYSTNGTASYDVDVPETQCRLIFL